MGAKQSSSGARTRAYSSSGGGPVVTSNGGGMPVASPGTSSGAEAHRSRTRSLGSVHNSANERQLVVRGVRGVPAPDSDSSTPEDQHGPFQRSTFMQPSSLPVHLFAFHCKFMNGLLLNGF